MTEMVLIETLRLAVPLHITQMRELTEDQRMVVGRRCAQTIAEWGDALQFKGGNGESRRRTREAFNALAKGLAALAHQPGGVEFRGVHWCVWDHPGGSTVTGCMAGAGEVPEVPGVVDVEIPGVSR
jgi:hypothetical protein